MITNKEIIAIILLYIIVYFILYLDHKINIRCNCNDYESSKKISIKVPLLISLLSFVVYKFTEPYINNYFIPYTQIRQSIITDMVDF